MADLFGIASNYFVIAKLASPEKRSACLEIDFWFDEVLKQHAESK